MKQIPKLFLVLIGAILLAANANATRWLTRDPMDIPQHMERDPHPGLDLNLYTFVRNNPVNKIDPYGLQVPPEVMELMEELQPEEEAAEAEAEKTWEAFSKQFSQLVQQARDTYPKLCSKFQWHHVIPKYLGGPEDQNLVYMEASYHQAITTAFRGLYGYGQGIPTDPTTVVNVVNTVYFNLPLPK